MAHLWFAYQCKSGEILFYYNKETGEHRWTACSCWRSKDPNKCLDGLIDNTHLMTTNIIKEEVITKACKQLPVRSVSTETDPPFPPRQNSTSTSTQTDDHIPDNLLAPSKGDHHTRNNIINRSCAGKRKRSDSDSYECSPELQSVDLMEPSKPNPLNMGYIPEGVSQIDVDGEGRNEDGIPFTYKATGRVKLYGCAHCNKAFTSASFLARHLQFHISRREFSTEDVGMMKHEQSQEDVVNPDGTLVAAGGENTNIVVKPAEGNNNNDQVTVFYDKDSLLVNGDLQVNASQQSSEASSLRNNLTYKCKVCHKRFAQQEDLTKHKSVHLEGMRYVCKHCDKGFSKMATLRRHVLTHEGVEPHWCCVCDRTFCRKDALVVHIRRMHPAVPKPGVGGHKCKECKKSFGTRRKYNGHLSHCYRKFRHRNGDSNKRQRSSERGSQEGDVKPVTNTSGTALRTQDERNNILSKKRHSCMHCGVSYKWRKNLVLHLKQCQGYQIQYDRSKKLYGCEKCDHKCRSLQELVLHHDKHSAPDKQSAPDKPKYHCYKCKKIFKRAFYLEKHLENTICVSNKPYKCRICPRSFDQPASLTKHMTWHAKTRYSVKAEPAAEDCKTGSVPTETEVTANVAENVCTTPFKCLLCPRAFDLPGSLSKHMTWHAKIQGSLKTEPHPEDCGAGSETAKAVAEDVSITPYKCRLCPRVFDKPISLSKHMGLHTKVGESMKAETEDCSAPQQTKIADAEDSSLNDVLQEDENFTVDETHGDVSRISDVRFKCTKCLSDYSSRCNFLRHLINVHSNDTSFQCHMCPKTFSTLEGISAHSRRVNRTKPHKCDECDAAFVVCSALFHHKNTVHKKKRVRHQTKKIKLLAKRRSQKPLKCDECDAAFVVRSALINHKNIVHDKKPKPARVRVFAKQRCKFCGKRFANAGNKVRHEKLHACSVCSQEFPTLNEAHQHEFTCKVMNEPSAQ